MKRLIISLLASGLFANMAHGAEVTLTSADIVSAIDIEMAIDEATNFDSEPGVVILDGSEGLFVYSEGDRSVNIRASNLTLRGINGAILSNCADGLFFDAVPVENILVEGITFNCANGNGLAWTGLGPRVGVTVRNNTIRAGIRGIVVGDAVDWTIANNAISGGSDPGLAAVDLVAATGSIIVNNVLVGFFGVRLPTDPAVFGGQVSNANKVVNNDIEAFETGIRLVQGASNNKLIGNMITVSQSPGIFLDASARNNKVHGNRMFLAGGGSVVSVEDLGTGNKVSGNRP